MNANTIEELKEYIRLAVESTILSSDSPLSKNRQVFNHIGYFKGYCVAKGWERDLFFEMELVRLTDKVSA